MTRNYFLERARSVHGYKYSYPNLSEKVTLKDNIKIMCNNKIFEQNASKHLSGRCPEKKVTKKSNQEFINECIKIWGNKYDYSLVDYKGALSDIKIIYDNVIYKQRASSHLNGISPESKKQSELVREEIVKFLNKYKLDYIIDYKIKNEVFGFYIPMALTFIDLDGSNGIYNNIDKSDYCEENFINLIKIKYEQINQIDQILWENLKILIKLIKT